MKCTDQLLRFSFERLDIRGELVYLNESWSQILARHDYPASVRRPLGEALAAVSLLRATLKFEGTLILQIQGKGPLHSLVTQIDSNGAVRGLARWEGSVPEAPLASIFGQGNIVISVLKKSGERYQSIVTLEGDSLAQALNSYFRQSEQLPSSFQLFVSGDCVAGFFLQALPPAASSAGSDADSRSRADREEDWQRVNILAETLQPDEIFSNTPDELLHKLFHEEDLRMFEPSPLHFACSCSREKVARTLVSLGREELDSIIADEGSIKVDCEFCNFQYRFDADDVVELYREDADSPQAPPGTTLH